MNRETSISSLLYCLLFITSCLQLLGSLEKKEEIFSVVNRDILFFIRKKCTFSFLSFCQLMPLPPGVLVLQIVQSINSTKTIQNFCSYVPLHDCPPPYEIYSYPNLFSYKGITNHPSNAAHSTSNSV